MSGERRWLRHYGGSMDTDVVANRYSTLRNHDFDDGDIPLVEFRNTITEPVLDEPIREKHEGKTYF